MTGPRLGQGMPTDDSWVSRQLADLQRQITELRAARTLDASTIGTGGTLTVDGALVVAGSETVSGTLNVTGNTVIGGTLSLPAGIIDNAALADPVTVGIHNGSASGQTTGTSYSTVYSGSIAVPAGFSRALVICMASVFTELQSGAGMADVLTTRALIGGTAGAEVSQSITAAGGVFVSASPNFGRLITGLSGGSIALAVQAHGFTGDFLAGGTGGSISANALFLR